MSTSKNVNDLFKQAQDEGILSPGAASAIQIVDPGANIQNALGVHPDDVQSSEVFLVTQMIDDSSSIAYASNEDAVCGGHNEVLDALSKSKQKDTILCHAKALNNGVIYPYCTIDHAVRLDRNNYKPRGETPLYRTAIEVLSTVLAKSQEFALNGVPVRTATLIVTDGMDVSNGKVTIGHVGQIIKDLLMQETHIIAGMGISDGTTDFKRIFLEMGIPDKWILTPANSSSEIRKAFAVFSQSAVRASQSAASFSKTALGGFTS